MAMEERRAKKARRQRAFTGATAIDIDRHYYVPWVDFKECLDIFLNQKKWLLLTGPFQSGKSSLAYALADAAWDEGFLGFVTTLTITMVEAANSPSVPDEEASDSFFKLLAQALERDSFGKLKVTQQETRGMSRVQSMLVKQRGEEPDVVWLIDEAGLLNEITRPSILRELLSGLRTCKEGSRSGGSLRLRNFSLVGTAKTRQLLATAGQLRVEEAETYAPATPTRHDCHDPYHPFPPGLPISPLSMEMNRGEDYLTARDILCMLRCYSQEHGVRFWMSQEQCGAPALETEQVLEKLATDIYELTSGYKGMVGSCCDYIQENAVRVWSRWKHDVRRGSVASHVFYCKVYSRIVSNIPTYSQKLQEFILDCVVSPTSGRPHSEADTLLVLPALNDGVLTIRDNTISISSPMLLAAILEDCEQATAEEVSLVGTFEEAVRQCFRYMKPGRLSKDEVLNHNEQPSEYIWQSEFLLALKLVLDKGYREHKYTILVECKKRNKNGQHRMRLDFHVKNAKAKPRVFEVQAKGGTKTIRDHMRRSEKYRMLFGGCEMNYIYFVYGHDTQAKEVIREESRSFAQVKCWFVQYIAETRVWNVELLQESHWHSVQFELPSSYPEFRFAVHQF